MIVLQGQERCPATPLGRREWIALCEFLLDVLDLDGAEFELRLVDDREMERLNTDFAHCPGPTNVLSFPSEDPSEGHLGSIILSVDTLEREALLYGQVPLEHAIRLLTHALLHLAGHDHGPDMEYLTEDATQQALAAFTPGDFAAWRGVAAG